MITFKVKKTDSNFNLINTEGLIFDTNKNFYNVKVSSLQFPYLQGNVRKIKKALGF